MKSQIQSCHRCFSKSRGPEIADIAQGVAFRVATSPHRSSLDVQLSVDNTDRGNTRSRLFFGINLGRSLKSKESVSPIGGSRERFSESWSFSPLILSPHLLSYSLYSSVRFLSFAPLFLSLSARRFRSPPPSRIDLRLFFWKPYIFRFTVRGAVECPASIQTRVHLRSSRQV